MELNKQPTEKRSTDSLIDFHSAWLTIQGEGPFAGRPAVFVRLAGCNLQCPLCDTDYTSRRETIPFYELVEKIKRLVFPANSGKLEVVELVVITGGEPFRQELVPLVSTLAGLGLTVQIETNGTLSAMPVLALPEWENQRTSIVAEYATIVCSPKTAKIHAAIASNAHAFKYVLQDGFICEDDGLPTSVLGFKCRAARPPPTTPKKNIFVQPLDEQHPIKNRRNSQAAAESAMRFGYTLSVQMHKIVGLP